MINTPIHEYTLSAAHEILNFVAPAAPAVGGTPAQRRTAAARAEETAEAWGELNRVLSVIGKGETAPSPIPLISFEGVPGAGKSTQIHRLMAELGARHGESCLIDPPTDLLIGRKMKQLFSCTAVWEGMRRTMPWLSPVMLSADLRMAVRRAMLSGARYAFSDRGIHSTLFYNLDAYAADEAEAWAAMQPHMAAFYRPAVTFFLDLPAEEAHKRVVNRRRGALRPVDFPQNMRENKAFLLRCRDRLPEVPFVVIDAARPAEEITAEIKDYLRLYLPQGMQGCRRNSLSHAADNH